MIQRFKDKFIVADNGCWEWTACLDKYGYGEFRFEGKTKRAHRVSWILKHGSIDDSLFICHKCDNPKCVNPDHLFLGTRLDNQRDMSKKNRGRNQNSNRTHCNNGHALIDPNVTYLKNERRCRICFNDRQRKARLNAKNARLLKQAQNI